jgi:Interferon-induced transmembrane protein
VGANRAPKSATTGTPTYFWQALVCVFLFPPTGVAAVIYSLLVTKRTQVGDATGASRASYLTRICCLWSLVGMAAALVIFALTGIRG